MTVLPPPPAPKPVASRFDRFYHYMNVELPITVALGSLFVIVISAIASHF